MIGAMIGLGRLSRAGRLDRTRHRFPQRQRPLLTCCVGAVPASMTNSTSVATFKARDIAAQGGAQTTLPRGRAHAACYRLGRMLFSLEEGGPARLLHAGPDRNAPILWGRVGADRLRRAHRAPADILVQASRICRAGAGALVCCLCNADKGSIAGAKTARRAWH